MQGVHHGVEVGVPVGEFDGLADGVGEAGAGRDDGETGAQAGVHVVVAGGGGGDDGRGEHRRVDAVGGVGESRVAVGLFRGGGRVAGVGPAVYVGADQGADPLAERVAVAGGQRRFESAEQIAVGDALGGEGTAGREFVEPQLCELGGGERLSVALDCLLYTSPSPRDGLLSRMPSSA